jgi:hypothetical protein
VEETKIFDSGNAVFRKIPLDDSVTATSCILFCDFLKNKKKIPQKKNHANFLIFFFCEKYFTFDKIGHMKFYITSAQNAALEALIDLQASDYEAKNWKAGEIHKFRSRAFIDNNILISFEDHKPTTFSYLSTNLGSIYDTRQSESDVEMKLNDKNFDLFASRVSSFQLLLSKVSHDGICFSQTAKVVMDFSWCDEYEPKQIDSHLMVKTKKNCLKDYPDIKKFQTVYFQSEFCDELRRKQFLPYINAGDWYIFKGITFDGNYQFVDARDINFEVGPSDAVVEYVGQDLDWGT